MRHLPARGSILSSPSPTAFLTLTRIESKDRVSLYTDRLDRPAAAFVGYGHPENGERAKVSWPTGPVTLPGSRLYVSFETATPYVKSEAEAPMFGFALTAVGHRAAQGVGGLFDLERELGHLGGVCLSRSPCLLPGPHFAQD